MDWMWTRWPIIVVTFKSKYQINFLIFVTNFVDCIVLLTVCTLFVWVWFFFRRVVVFCFSEKDNGFQDNLRIFLLRPHVYIYQRFCRRPIYLTKKLFSQNFLFSILNWNKSLRSYGALEVVNMCIINFVCSITFFDHNDPPNFLQKLFWQLFAPK